MDTYLCASKGVNNLLDLAEKSSSKFTFFYNMGRGIHYKSFFNKKRKGDAPPAANKLSNLYKLGKFGYLRTAILNPNVGKSYPDIIKLAAQENHEIGLHGGKNHGEWMGNIDVWSESRIKSEIKWGISELDRLGISNVTSFSSPGWKGTEDLNRILWENGFSVIADEHGHNLEVVKRVKIANPHFYSVPTNLLGEPGGVGYIENMCANNLNYKEMLNKFQYDLNKITKLGVMYDHPYFSGIHELKVLGSMIDMVLEQKFYIAKFSEVPRLMGLS